MGSCKNVQKKINPTGGRFKTGGIKGPALKKEKVEVKATEEETGKRNWETSFEKERDVCKLSFDV